HLIRYGVAEGHSASIVGELRVRVHPRLVLGRDLGRSSSGLATAEDLGLLSLLALDLGGFGGIQLAQLSSGLSHSRMIALAGGSLELSLQLRSSRRYLFLHVLLMRSIQGLDRSGRGLEGVTKGSEFGAHTCQ